MYEPPYDSHQASREPGAGFDRSLSSLIEFSDSEFTGAQIPHPFGAAPAVLTAAQPH